MYKTYGLNLSQKPFQIKFPCYYTLTTIKLEPFGIALQNIIKLISGMIDYYLVLGGKFLFWIKCILKDSYTERIYNIKKYEIGRTNFADSC